MQIDTFRQGRNSIFISYSHKDAKHLRRLQIHFVPSVRAGLDVWDDTRLEGGQLWREEIRRALESARVAILLVSADFLASEFITENELPRLLSAAKSGGTAILPVIVGFCNFSKSPLAQFQAINEPSKPLNRLRPDLRDEVWARVVALAESHALSTPMNGEETPVLTLYKRLVDIRTRVATLAAMQELRRYANSEETPTLALEDVPENIDAFWTQQRIHELEHDLEVLVEAGNIDEDTAWLQERLMETAVDDKARMLTIWDSVSELEMLSQGDQSTPVDSRLIGFLHDWRVRHGG